MDGQGTHVPCGKLTLEGQNTYATAQRSRYMGVGRQRDLGDLRASVSNVLEQERRAQRGGEGQGGLDCERGLDGEQCISERDRPRAIRGCELVGTADPRWEQPAES